MTPTEAVITKLLEENTLREQQIEKLQARVDVLEDIVARFGNLIDDLDDRIFDLESRT